MKREIPSLVLSATILTLGLMTGNAFGGQLSIGELLTSGTTVVVAPKASAEASGAALLAAINGIADASESRPYLVSIMPGIYDLGNQTLQMKSYVALQGAGAMETKIIRNDGTSEGPVVLLEGVVNAHLSRLTVENENGSGIRSAITINESSPYIQNVWALIKGGDDENIGVFITNASPVMEEMRCIASGQGDGNAGVWNLGGSPTMRNVYAEGSGAVSNFGILNLGGSPVMHYLTVVAKGGDFAIGVLNDEKAAPKMVHVGVTASAALDNTGIRNLHSSDVTIADSSVTVLGGDYAKGIDTAQASTARINNVSIYCSEAKRKNYGVLVDSADSFLEQVVVMTDGTEDVVGVICEDSSKVRINHSSIYGANSTLSAGGEDCDVKVGHSHLNGGPAVGCTCAGVTDENYNFYAGTCP